jgi:sister-chromatid-cohesion protein PDS5
MSRYVGQYFGEVALDASGNAEPKSTNGHRRSSDAVESDDGGDAPTGPSAEDLKHLGQAHKLLRELWRASPLVLQNVIPQLEVQLSAENVELRSMATKTLGDIISGIGGMFCYVSELVESAQL